jgi:hypothetical protein
MFTSHKACYLVKRFNDIRTLPIGFEDPAVKNLRERVKRVCQKAAIDENWWATRKFADALVKGEFSEPVCILCDRFCYVTSFDFDACPKSSEAIELMEDTGLSPEEIEAFSVQDKDL